MEKLSRVLDLFIIVISSIVNILCMIAITKNPVYGLASIMILYSIFHFIKQKYLKMKFKMETFAMALVIPLLILSVLIAKYRG
ncbi:hypothetical protein [Clostridium intestinale]|uniref:Uncharacterized protein n=1 Tax=Clostridium intestinale DSM 6191 TaxID=1121320 RepID=A0A1M5ZDS9_9CLOT|nr:hypothetical protein [Clostridium intestinale]SHI22342.1 hypothetical protein SAMN02745941_02837 [Clostridium intestinale DSM 6191]